MTFAADHIAPLNLAGTFIYISLMTRNGVPVELLSQFGLILAIIFIIHVLTFVLSYIYFELRGFRQ